VEAGGKRRDVADWAMPVSGLDVVSFRVGRCGRVFWRRVALEWRRCAVIISPLEIKGLVAGAATSVFILVVTFTAGGIYRDSLERETEPGNKPPDAAALVAKGRAFFFQSCAHCHGQDADGGEDAPSLLKLQISGAHMALVIQSGIKDEMPSFSKLYNGQDTAAIVAFLKTLH
jgi:mono/diheme cytochrome c family protein